MIKLLIGGSPCTYWSIAQTQHRETKASGMGWELFKNYLIAKEKFNPDFFLYENNVSASQAIKDMIKHELGVSDAYQMNMFTQDTGVRYIEINSALVSAQNRQRFYVHNCGEVEQPQDRKILLEDILESSIDEPVQSSKLKVAEATAKGYTEIMQGDCVDLSNPNSKTRRGRNMKHKANCLTTSPEFYQYCGTIDNPIYPVNITSTGKSQTIKATYNFTSIANICCYSSTYGSTGVAIPTKQKPSEQFNGCGKDLNAMKRVYEVKNGQIMIKGKQFPIKLKDGRYIIRKLTVAECARLQTMPDDYCRAVSDSKALQGLGNGWTAEVIIHILNGALANVPKDEEIVVLSMYDGIGTGRYCLDKMGFTNVKYYAYEIDKYAMKIATSNYPDIIECGDAFAVRNEDWKLNPKE